MTPTNRRMVLDMLAEGKISVDEAEKLLDALGRQRSTTSDVASTVADAAEQATDIIVGAVEEARASMEDSGPNAERVRRSFPVGDAPSIVVDNFNGRVEIDGSGPEGEVTVDAELSRPDSIEYSATQEGDTIRVEARPRRSRSPLSWLRFNRGARIKVAAPPRVALDVTTSNARLAVRRVSGSGSLRTSNGRVVADDLGGEFVLTTSNGRVESRRLNGKFDLKSSNGRVSVSDSSGEFGIETSNGKIEFDGSLEPGGRNRFTSSNGSILAALGANPSVSLDAATSNGSINCNRPIDAQIHRRRRLEGVIGDGESTLSLRTSNGSITVQ